MPELNELIDSVLVKLASQPGQVLARLVRNVDASGANETQRAHLQSIGKLVEDVWRRPLDTPGLQLPHAGSAQIDPPAKFGLRHLTPLGAKRDKQWP